MAARGLSQLRHRWHAYRKAVTLATGIGIAAGTSVVLLHGWRIPIDGEQGHVQTDLGAGLFQQQVSRAVAAVTSASDAAVGAAKAVATRWLAEWSDDLETREALLAFGSTRLLDFLLATATEEDSNQQQVEAEHVLCNLLTGRHTATAVLQRPMAIQRLLQHVASGRASAVLVERLAAAAAGGADFPGQLSEQEAAATVAVLQDHPESEVEPLALAMLTALASAGPQQRQQLAAGGITQALATAAMSAVRRGEAAGGLLRSLCRVMLILAEDGEAVLDADLALWVRPLLLMAADAVASGDLELADVAMQSFVRCAGYGGTAVRGALKDLHVLPTLECLARSTDLGLRARAMAAVGPLVKVGLLESEQEKSTWRDRALGWLVTSGGFEQDMLDQARQQQQEGTNSSCLTSRLLSYLGVQSAAEPRRGPAASSVAVAAAVAPGHVLQLPAAALQPGSSFRQDIQALRRACVSALKALSREESAAGLQVAHLWLAALLALLAPRVSAASSVTQIVPPEVYAAQLLRQQREEEQQQAGGGGTVPGNRAGSGADSTSSNSSSSSSRGSRPGALQDAAPVTAAYVASVAEDLRAASAAAAHSWQADALELPATLDPSSLTPAVLEAYPATARIMDLALAQQRLCRALEVLSAIIADDTAKQQWMVNLGVLPLLERFTMYTDATAAPDAWLERYSPAEAPAGLPATASSGSSSAGGAAAAAPVKRSWFSSWWGKAPTPQQQAAAAREEQQQQQQQQAEAEGELESALLAQQLKPAGKGGSDAGSSSADEGPSTPDHGGAAGRDGAASSAENPSGLQPPAAAAAAAAAASTAAVAPNSSSWAASSAPVGGNGTSSSSSGPSHDGSGCGGGAAAAAAGGSSGNSPASNGRSSSGRSPAAGGRQGHRFLASSFAFAQGATSYSTIEGLLGSPASAISSSSVNSMPPLMDEQLLAAAEEQQQVAGLPADANGAALCVARQAARVLSVLCMLPEVAEKVAHGKWLGWLQHAAETDDCRLSSSATRALLHVEACLQHHGRKRTNPLSNAALELSSFLEELWPFQTSSSSSSSSSSSWRPAVCYPDGIHLLQPHDARHWVFTRQATPTLLESLTAAATAAAVNAAADLSDSDFSDLPQAWLHASPGSIATGATSSSSSSSSSDASSAAQQVGPVQRLVDSLFDRIDQQIIALSERWQLDELESAAVAAATGAVGAAAIAASPSSAAGSIYPSSNCCSSTTAPPADILVPPADIAAQLATPEAVMVPEVDVVFVHGIRGGPFVTWRKGVGPRRPTQAHAQAVMDCWPTAWLAEDIPGARLLTVEYNAPATGWEGESLSLPDMTPLVLDKLLAAGVGQRPVVFVTHSMGGLLVKEMLSLSADAPRSSPRADLAASTRGVVFYSTPHFGSGLAALGWKLRHVPGASPAPSVHHLSPGPHLVAINQRLKELCEQRGLGVLSFLEGQATELAGFIPKVVIVPPESANPGFGKVIVLPDADHITVCKPRSKQDVAYAELLQFVRACLGLGQKVEEEDVAIAAS